MTTWLPLRPRKCDGWKFDVTLTPKFSEVMGGTKLIIHLGKFHHDLTVRPHWKSWFILGESSPNGRTIQISELL